VQHFYSYTSLNQDLGIDGRINIRMDLREIGWEGMHRFIWLRIETADGHLFTCA